MVSFNPFGELSSLKPDPSDPTDSGVKIEDLTHRDAAREEWLYNMARKVAPWFAEAGYPLPLPTGQIGIGVGFTTSGNRRTNASIGQCHYPYKKVMQTVNGEQRRVSVFNPEGKWQVIIRIDQEESVWVSQILVHELCHVALPAGEGHKANFRKLAYRMGLTMESKNTIGCNGATDITPYFVKAITPFIDELGPYPHTALDFQHEQEEEKKKKAKQQKGITVECDCCGNKARISIGVLEKGGVACHNLECDEIGVPMQLVGGGGDKPAITSKPVPNSIGGIGL